MSNPCLPAGRPACGRQGRANTFWFWLGQLGIEHLLSGKSLVLHYSERTIYLEGQDTAAVIFNKCDLPLGNTPPKIVPEGKSLKIGVEVGR